MRDKAVPASRRHGGLSSSCYRHGLYIQGNPDPDRDWNVLSYVLVNPHIGIGDAGFENQHDVVVIELESMLRGVLVIESFR